MQNGVGGISHFHSLSGSIDMKNHRGACRPCGHEWRYMAKSNMAAVGHDENSTLLFFGVYASVIPLIILIFCVEFISDIVLTFRDIFKVIERSRSGSFRSNSFWYIDETDRNKIVTTEQNFVSVVALQCVIIV